MRRELRWLVEILISGSFPNFSSLDGKKFLSENLENYRYSELKTVGYKRCMCIWFCNVQLPTLLSCLPGISLTDSPMYATQRESYYLSGISFHLSMYWVGLYSKWHLCLDFSSLALLKVTIFLYDIAHVCMLLLNDMNKFILVCSCSKDLFFPPYFYWGRREMSH